IDHAKTLVIGRAHVCATGPDQLRADTPRLSWLDEEDGEKEMLGNRRKRERYESAPVLGGRRRDGDHERDDWGPSRGGGERKRGDGWCGVVLGGRRGVAVGRSRLSDGVR